MVPIVFILKDGSSRFKRSLLEGGLGLSREKRELVVNCLEGSTAQTSILEGTAQINCVKDALKVPTYKYTYTYLLPTLQVIRPSVTLLPIWP